MAYDTQAPDSPEEFAASRILARFRAELPHLTLADYDLLYRAVLRQLLIHKQEREMRGEAVWPNRAVRARGYITA